MLHLANNIKYIRLLAGKTQTEFGELIGCSKDSVYTYEKGKATPDELILSKISKIAGVTIEDLLHKDLSKREIKVIDPESKDMVYTLSSSDQAAKIIELEATVKALQSVIDKLLESR